MQNFIVIAVFLALGALSKRLFALPEKAPFYINKFIINFALPAVILLKLPHLVLDKNIVLPMLAPWLLAIPLTLGMLGFARRLQWSRETLGAMLLLTLYSNSSYFGFPMVRAFFGDAGMPYAIVFDQLGNFVMFAVGTPILLAYFGADEKFSAFVILKRIFSFPPFYALIAGILLNGVAYPPLLDRLLAALGTSMAPLAMFIVGSQLSLRVPAQIRQPLAIAIGARLLFLPALTLLFFYLTDHRELAARVTIFEAGMPTMITAGIVAMSANLSPRLCTATVGLGLLLSLLTLPFWFAVTNALLG